MNSESAANFGVLERSGDALILGRELSLLSNWSMLTTRVGTTVRHTQWPSMCSMRTIFAGAHQLVMTNEDLLCGRLESAMSSRSVVSQKSVDHRRLRWN